MAWQLTDDVDAYLAAAGDFLRMDAARNTVQLSAAQTVQAQGLATFGDAAPLYGWWTGPDGAVGAAFLHTPPFPIVLTALPPGAAPALAALLADLGHYPPAVSAAPGTGTAFAAGKLTCHSGGATRAGHEPLNRFEERHRDCVPLGNLIKV